MKKLNILIAISAIVGLSACEMTVNTEYPDYTIEAQPELIWEVNKETGLIEQKEDMGYKVIIKEKEYQLPDFES